MKSAFEQFWNKYTPGCDNMTDYHAKKSAAEFVWDSALIEAAKHLQEEVQYYKNPSTREPLEYYIKCKNKVEALEEAIDITNKLKETK